MTVQKRQAEIDETPPEIGRTEAGGARTEPAREEQVKWAEGAAGFQIIPAVDVLGAEAVRLERGNFERVNVRAGDPAGLVQRFARQRPPFIHLVDLEAARAGGVRPAFIANLIEQADGVPLQVAGGVRSVADAEALLKAGAGRVVIATAAFSGGNAMHPYVELLEGRLVVALDVRRGGVATEGWDASAGLTVTEAVGRCAEAGVPRIMCTAIDRDGTMNGPDLELLALVRERSTAPVLAAGGIRSESDLAALASLGLEGAVVGRALLEGALDFR